MKDLLLLSNISLNATSRREMLDGVEHLVVPAIAIREGVLNNILYPADQLSQFVESWNGVPVPVRHPTKDGEAVTANAVEWENSVNIGRFYNVSYSDGAIRGEIWINIGKAQRLGFSDIVESLESGEVMEISTGLHALTKEGTGTFNNVSYTSVIDTIRPDHLALLPDEEGACSVKDGCGAMRNNCGGGKNCKCTKPQKKSLVNRLKSWFGVNEDVSFDKTRSAVGAQLRLELGEDPWPYIVDIFDSYIIYEFGAQMLKRSYVYDKDNLKVTLSPDVVEVKIVTTYEPILANRENKTNMKPENKVALVSALALALVANKADAVTEDKKASLAALPDDMLLNMAAQYKLKEDGTPENVVPVTPTAPVVGNSTGTITAEERMELNTLKQEREQRLANKRAMVCNVHTHVTAEVAATMGEVALDALLGAAPAGTVTANYALGGVAPVQTNAEKEYAAPSVFLAAPTATPTA